jgi:hypothetical protein
MQRISPYVFLFLASASGVFAQTAKPTPVTDSSTSARTIPATPAAPLPSQDFSVKLKWSDATGQVTIPVQNTSDKSLKILAVQTSGNFFVADFPKTIPPNKSGDVSLLFDAKTGTSSDSDVLRLKTDQGEKLVRIVHDREQVAVLSSSQLTWTVGEKATAKTTTLRISGNATKAVKARTPGGGTAKLDDLGGGQFQITVTPKSTAEPTTFPVIIELDPQLPGVTPVVTGVVVNTKS